MLNLILILIKYNFIKVKHKLRKNIYSKNQKQKKLKIR